MRSYHFAKVLLVIHALAAVQAAVEIPHAVLSAGGGTAGSASFKIRSTLGQSTGDPASSAHYQVRSSFWSTVGPPVFWADDFDTYPTGAELIGRGGWTGWDNNPNAGALASAAQAQTSPNSVAVLGDSDLVHRYGGATSGLWTLSGQLFVPGGFTSGCTGTDCGSYLVLLSTYQPGGPYHWSAILHADSQTGRFIRDGVTPAHLPLIRDEWVLINVVIDLDADSYRVFYGGQELGVAQSWTGGVNGQGGGARNIAALDLFANNSTVVYWDDFALSGPPASAPTRGDLNCDGDVDFDDINPFVLALSNPAGYAQRYPNCSILNGDCNGDGLVNFADINAFVALLVGTSP